ncbi:hypothetical protein NFJ02_03g104320 [Pycnococcus provasolii]
MLVLLLRFFFEPYELMRVGDGTRVAQLRQRFRCFARSRRQQRRSSKRSPLTAWCSPLGGYFVPVARGLAGELTRQPRPCRKPDDVHDAVLEVKRVADSLQANNAKRVKMLSFDGEFTDAWQKHGIVIDALARSALDEVASTTSHAVLLKKANDAIAKLTSLEVKQLDELIAECLADGDHVLLPTQAQSSRTKHGVSATTRTVFETIGQSPPHGQQGCQKKPIRSMDEEMCVLRQVATHRDAHHKRLGEHVAIAHGGVNAAP